MRNGWRGALLLLLGLLVPASLAAQDELAAARAWREQNAHRIVGELVEFLSMPNVATNPADIQRNAEWLKARMERSGVKTEIVSITGGRPVVFGELHAAGATRTLLFYCHYDGQAVDSSRWNNSEPFKPALRSGAPGDWSTIPFPAPGRPFRDDWRIYARSASDDKSPIIALLAALDALRAQGREPTVNLKFVFDGEEEQGSPNLHEFIARYRDRLAADAMIIGDGPVHPSGRPTIFFGNRGIMTLDLTVYGPRVPLHSGHY
ncbi:MAG: M20/M25/M40 family metallo-hydrolase, partial [Acidobacteria bacterium]|nr:M20/M25/M40 family metallo-hydrolase [Acidobacteriota bacterium]